MAMAISIFFRILGIICLVLAGVMLVDWLSGKQPNIKHKHKWILKPIYTEDGKLLEFSTNPKDFGEKITVFCRVCKLHKDLSTSEIEKVDDGVN